MRATFNEAHFLKQFPCRVDPYLVSTHMLKRSHLYTDNLAKKIMEILVFI